MILQTILVAWDYANWVYLAGSRRMNFPPEQQWKVGLPGAETKMLILSEEVLEGLGRHWPKRTNSSQEEKDQESGLQYSGYQ